MIGTPMDPGSWSPELLARFDIVGMDPRGVGESGGIRCLSDAEREANLALDFDPALTGGLPREASPRRRGSWRRAAGPASIRRCSRTWPPTTSPATWPWSAARSGRSGSATPFGGGEPEAAFDALIAQLEAAPLDVPAAPGIAAGRLDGAGALLAARISMFTRTLWPVLGTGLIAAQNGTILLALSQAMAREPDGTPAGFLEANAAVNCLDRAVPADLAAHERNAVEIAAAAPRFGRLSGLILLSRGTAPTAPAAPASTRPSTAT